jgi:hypothetical protein
MGVLGHWTVVKMLDGTWNVRDEQTGEWERDAVGLRKPTATKIADALNNQQGAVEERDWLVRFAAQARGWTPERVEQAMVRDLAASTPNEGQ